MSGQAARPEPAGETLGVLGDVGSGAADDAGAVLDPVRAQPAEVGQPVDGAAVVQPGHGDAKVAHRSREVLSGQRGPALAGHGLDHEQPAGVRPRQATGEETGPEAGAARGPPGGAVGQHGGPDGLRPVRLGVAEDRTRRRPGPAR